MTSSPSAPLLDAGKNQIQVSDKQSWCLAPTDTIDLSVPNANWGQLPQDVYSSCAFGQPGALWSEKRCPWDGVTRTGKV